MCGIAGLIRYGGLSPEDRARARRLERALRHRGPDGAGIVYSARAALVHTRLSLVDLAPHTLPMQSPDGRYTLLYNGEIYNHAALREELEDQWEFQTRTDTEAALAALCLWGERAVARFAGMFAFFFWDNEEGKGLAAVDPLSVKPLLYHAGDSLFAVCSEAGPLVECGVIPFRPDEEAIAEHLTAPYFTGAQALPFANLRRLQPGHVLRLEEGRVTVAAYRADAEAGDLLESLREAVRRQAAADAPVGLFLSGGVDSSLLAALVPGPMPAYTIRYAHGPEDFADSLIVKSDDLPFAAECAAAFGHRQRVVTPENYEAALLRTVRANDLIAAWEQEVSQNVLAERAARDVKAVLVGDAADETHYGYSFLLHPERLASPRLLMDYFGHLPTRPGVGHFVEKYERFAVARGHGWQSPEAQRMAISCLIRNLWLTRLLHNGDLHLMAHGVEGRVPFSDPAVLAAADAVPVDMALANGVEKHYLRTVAERVLPHRLAWRPKSALTKHLAARGIIHTLFRRQWERCGALLEPYVDADFVDQLDAPSSDRESGLRFRLLAVLTWMDRFSESKAA
ncbi:MAG TPA: asparagine synthase (glutamine-hydrolyzing) [Bryobacteraceae bacterium]|nr:asparagine synthase (glutamine-hydrolyzing) [Bryobacteraceae bacterium]